MLAVVHDPLVPDAPGIERVAQHLMDVPAREAAATDRPAARQHPHPAAKPEPQRLRMHRPHGAEAPVELEELAHHRRLVLADLQRASVGIVAEGHQPAHPEAAPLGGGDLVADALGGHLALELREAQEHVQASAGPCWSRC